MADFAAPTDKELNKLRGSVLYHRDLERLFVAAQKRVPLSKVVQYGGKWTPIFEVAQRTGPEYLAANYGANEEDAVVFAILADPRVWDMSDDELGAFLAREWPKYGVFPTLVDLRSAVESLVQASRDEFEATWQQFQTFRDVEAQFRARDPLPVDTATVTSTTFRFRTFFGGAPLAEVPPQEVFRSLQACEHVPYIQLTQPAQPGAGIGPAPALSATTWIRVFRGAPHAVSTPKAKKLNKLNHLYFNVWAAPGDETESAFLLVRTDLASGLTVVKIASPRADHNAQAADVVKKIRACTAGGELDFSGAEVEAYRGDFAVASPVGIEEATFLHFVLTDFRANRLLYVEEAAKLAAERKHMIVRYGNFLGASLAPKKAGQKHAFDLSAQIESEAQPCELGQSAWLLPFCAKFSFSKTADMHLVRKFAVIVATLLSMYEEDLPQIAALYEGLAVRQKKAAAPKAAAPRAAPKAATSRLAALKLAAPGVFVDGYASQCQGKKQPTVISREEYEAIVAGLNPERDDPAAPRRVDALAFVIGLDETPPRPRTIYLTSDNPATPSMGLQVNTRGTPRSKAFYPLVPCTFNLSNARMRVDLYERYRAVVPEERAQIARGLAKQKAQASGAHKVLTPLALGADGAIPEVLSEFMRAAVSPAVGIVFRRVGVLTGPSSFLACLAFAADERWLAGNPERSTWELRTAIAEKTHPNLLKQELYDRTDEEITAGLRDPDVFLDPAVYFRALEEHFGVNIVTLAITPESGRIELPRAQLFHTRVWRFDRTVVVVKFRGTQRAQKFAEHPACELIAAYDRTAPVATSFAGKQGGKFRAMLEAANRVTRVRPISPAHPDASEAAPEAYVAVDWQRFLEAHVRARCVGQMIDGNGKMRALAVAAEGAILWVFFDPSQPTSLPSVEPRPAELATAALARRILERPPVSLADYTGDAHAATGLGFEARIGEGVFRFWVPVVGAAPGVPLASAAVPFAVAPGKAEQEATIERLNTLRLRASVLKQLVRWVYLLWAHTRPNTDFETAFFQNGANGEWSVYDVPLRLRARDPSEAMALLGEGGRLAGLVRGGKFVVSPRLRELLKYDLQNFARWVKGASFMTTEGELAFKVNWAYEIPASAGAEEAKPTAVPEAIRGFRQVVREGSRVRVVRAPAGEAGIENAVVGTELSGVETPPSAAEEGREAVFASVHQRNKFLIQELRERGQEPPEEWLLEFPWLSPAGSLKTKPRLKDFKIKEPFFLRVAGGEIFMVQNVAPDPHTARRRAVTVAVVWLRQGVNLGPEAPLLPEAGALVPTVFQIQGDELVPAASSRPELTPARRGRTGPAVASGGRATGTQPDPNIRIIEYQPGKYGALLSPDHVASERK